MDSLTYLIVPATLGLLYTVGLVIYRLVFHPLARVPGPKLAAATQWYEGWYDLFVGTGGTYWKEIDRMHEKYGPIVRINPHEVHIKDSEYYEVLYSHPSNGIRDKHVSIGHLTGTPLGLHAAVDHDVHRKRRAALSNMFSKKSISDLQPTIRSAIDRLFNNFVTAAKQNDVVELRASYLALTTDLICERSFKHTLDLLGSKSRAKQWHHTIGAVVKVIPAARQISWLVPFAMSLPIWLVKQATPALYLLVKFVEDMRTEASEAVKDFASSEYSNMPEKDEFERYNQKNDTLFRACLTSSDLPPEEKHMERLAQEAFTIIAAGGETTARLLTVSTFYTLLHKERILPRLREELKSVMPSPNTPLDWKTAEQLPWLTAIIKEALRVQPLFTSRFPLTARETLHYKQHALPAGTTISMTLRDVLLDPEIFENPKDFRPERWLADNPTLAHISHYWMPFSRGSRSCIGLNLALCEGYLTYATLFRRFDLELYDTNEERDIEVVRDGFVGEPVKESPGVRVKVTAVRE